MTAIMAIVALLGVASPPDTPIDLSTLVDKVAREPWPEGLTPSGTGFLVSGNGLVFTASHVVAGCKAVYVARRAHLDHVVPAILIGADSRLDAALLSVPQLTGAPLHFSDVSPEHDTDLFIAGAQSATTQLRASALGMRSEDTLGRTFHYRAQLTAGFSGAPIFDRHGLVAAVVVGKLENRPGIGIGVTGHDLTNFLHYFGVPPPVHPQQGVTIVIGDLGSDEPAFSDLAEAVVRVTCR